MRKTIELPTGFDFIPLQDAEQTRIHPFFENLRRGKLTTTKCAKCGLVAWQPRVVCAHCHADEMEWVDLPSEGTLFAFSAVVVGAPLTMEQDVPYVVALVQLDGTEIKVMARIDGARYEDLKIGDRVRLKVITLDDGRVWFRFVPAK